MKYFLEKASPRLFFVVDDMGFKFSKKPMYKKQARAQQKALYAAQEEKKREKRDKRRIRGGAEDDPVPPVDPSQQPPEPVLTPAQQRAADLSKTLQAQQDEFSKKEQSSIYGQYPVPFIPPAVMNARGIPWFLAQHPSEYSANPNQVMLYRNEGQFLRSPIYQKYKDDIIPYEERAGYGVRFSQIIPGKPFRIVFRSRSFDDNNQYYMDLDDADSFMDFLDEAKDSNMLTPVEFISARFIAKNKAEMSKIADDSAAAYKVAYNQGLSDQLEADQRAQQEAEAQQGEDDSGFTGALGAVGSVVGKVFDFL
jgi:hypothetical protein